jgi:hypothetical protein
VVSVAHHGVESTRRPPDVLARGPPAAGHGARHAARRRLALAACRRPAMSRGRWPTGTRPSPSGLVGARGPALGGQGCSTPEASAAMARPACGRLRRAARSGPGAASPMAALLRWPGPWPARADLGGHRRGHEPRAAASGARLPAAALPGQAARGPFTGAASRPRRAASAARGPARSNCGLARSWSVRGSATPAACVSGLLGSHAVFGAAWFSLLIFRMRAIWYSYGTSRPTFERMGLALLGHLEIASGNLLSNGFRPCSRITMVLASISTGDEFVMCSSITFACCGTDFLPSYLLAR